MVVLFALACATSPPRFGRGGEAGDPGGGVGAGDDTGTGSDTADTAETGDTAIEGTGFAEGDTAWDLVAFGPDGAVWSLYDQAGTPVALLAGNATDGQSPSVLAAMGGADGEDIVTVGFFGLDENGMVADQSDASRWASDAGVDVVIYDPALVTWATWAGGLQRRALVMDAGLVIRHVQEGWIDTEALVAAMVSDHDN